MDIALRDGEIYVKDQDIQLTTDRAEDITQQILMRLRSFRGDWFLNTNFGIEYFQEIFRKPIRFRRIEDIYKREIGAVDGVKEITDFTVDVDKDTRKITVRYSVSIDTGETISSQVVNI